VISEAFKIGFSSSIERERTVYSFRPESLYYYITNQAELHQVIAESDVPEVSPPSLTKLKEEFCGWFIKQDGLKHNYFSTTFGSNKDKLLENLTKYEELYLEQFGTPIFEVPRENYNEFIENLESSLYLEDGDFFQFSLKTSTHMPRAILGKQNYIKFLKEFFSKKEITQIDFNLESFQAKTGEAGLIFSPQLIQRFVASLCTKPFVICSGLSGSGKTKLAQAFAQWITADKSQYSIVPVGADWTNREPLLGYPNALNKEEYVSPENGVLDLMIRAKQNINNTYEATKPYFLILDEMNLSHVERYFADFLSTMESKNSIPLHQIEKETNNIPQKIKLPKNLFIVGTVNIDETTYMFSPKVLDRANTIEFRVSNTDISAFLKNPKDIALEKLKSKGTDMAANFVEIATATRKGAKIEENYQLTDSQYIINNFFVELQKSGAEFGYRTAFEISKLIYKLKEFGLTDKNDQLDIAIMQKMLPKLHGSRTKLTRTLKPLAKLCLVAVNDTFDKEYFENFENINFKEDDNIKYKLSFEKIMRMYKNAVENGFASYAEA
jgi:5-methylcytosine-specific restriction protein B